MSHKLVLYEGKDHVGRIILNDPDHRNAMSPALLDDYRQAVEQAIADTRIRCVVLTGTGSCFSAGADLRSSLQRGATGSELADERSFAMYEPFLSTLEIAVPVIGAIDGHAVGGGFGLALLCDIRLVAAEARLGANFARLGLHSGMGISFTLPRLVGPGHAAELLYTGRLISGKEAVAMGMANEALPVEEVEPKAMTLAQAIAASAPYAVRGMKRTMFGALHSEIRAAARHEAVMQAASLLTEDAKEGVAAFLEKRSPRFRNQ